MTTWTRMAVVAGAFSLAVVVARLVHLAMSGPCGGGRGGGIVHPACVAPDPNYPILLACGALTALLAWGALRVIGRRSHPHQPVRGRGDAL